jgi:glycosyltransferase involved in cell wall biosynthesis
LEAAKKLQGKANFRLVGSVRVVPEVAGYLQSHLELIGQVPRSHIHAHYAWADVFLLPSLCEGSATVTYEALAAGLPVIATPNTGAIIRDQIEGFIIPIRDVDTIVEKLQLLANWPDLLAEMSESARQRAVYGSFDNYAKRLIQVFK